jgi:hypothetical protein
MLKWLLAFFLGILPSAFHQVASAPCFALSHFFVPLMPARQLMRKVLRRSNWTLPAPTLLARTQATGQAATAELTQKDLKN